MGICSVLVSENTWTVRVGPTRNKPFFVPESLQLPKEAGKISKLSNTRILIGPESVVTWSCVSRFTVPTKLHPAGLAKELYRKCVSGGFLWNFTDLSIKHPSLLHTPLVLYSIRWLSCVISSSFIWPSPLSHCDSRWAPGGNTPRQIVDRGGPEGMFTMSVDASKVRNCVTMPRWEASFGRSIL